MNITADEYDMIQNMDWIRHTHSFNGPLFGTTRVSQHQKGHTSLDFTEARQ